jgi:translation initiation factor 3 subunit I
LKTSKQHADAVVDFQFSGDKTFFITASKDTTAKLFDAQTLQCKKTYKTERPVNAASIAPTREEVLLGGGQEAMNVTTTSTRAGKFECRFFHAIYEDEIGRVKGHFGPINTVAYHPAGLGFASGAEDGYVRLHDFDASYFEFQYDI